MMSVSQNFTLPPTRDRYKPDPSKSLSCTICGSDTEFDNGLCFECNCQISDGDNSDIATRVNESNFVLVDKTIEGIISKVQEYTGITDITIKTRKREVCEARQIAHYVARLVTNLSLAKIGKEIGLKDHATVLNSCSVVETLLLNDKVFREKYGGLIEYYEGN